MREQVRQLEALSNDLEGGHKSDAIDYSSTKAILAAQSAMHSINALDRELQSSGTRRTSAGPSPPSAPPPASVASSTGPRPPPRKVHGEASSAPPLPPMRTSTTASSRGLPNDALVDSLVSTLVAEGIGHDTAMAAVLATGGGSLDAARRWAKSTHKPAEVNASVPGGTLRTIRTLKCSPMEQRALMRQDSESSAAGSQSGSKPPTPGAGRSLGSSSTTPRRTGSSGSSAGTPRSGSMAATSTLPWTVPSPQRSPGSRTEGVASVEIQVRVTGGKLVQLERKFFRDDSLKTVMHELLRVLDTNTSRYTDFGFVVPIPRAKYEWQVLTGTTLQDAGLCPRGTLVLIEP